MLSSLWAAISAIPILDKWAERALSSYKQWKFDQAVAASNAAINNADHGETGDLNNDIGSKT